MFCLPQFAKDRFVKAIQDGSISTEKMTSMSSIERQALLGDFLGKEYAKEANTLFESKLILKSQKIGLQNWVKQIEKSKENQSIHKDIISRIERMEKVLDAQSKQEFLQDLAAKRLGFSVTFEQAQIIMKSTESIKEAHSKLTDTVPEYGADGKLHPLRYDFGLKTALLDKYITSVKESGMKKMSVGEWILSPDRWVDDVAGTMKSLKSGFDNSFFGRQGRQAMVENPKMWLNNFVKSWGDIAKEYKGVDAMVLAKAEVLGRKNALNGKWSNMGLDIHIAFEEAYPSHLLRGLAGSGLAPIKLLGRTYKASESAFSAGAMRMRADLADMFIKMGEEQGVNFMDKTQAKPIGELVNSMTGRGHLRGLERSANTMNILMFSARFLKSNIDILTAPLKYGTMKAKQGFGHEYNAGEVFARRTAAKNTMKLIGGIAAILYVADQLQPGSVGWDPRGSSFGKIKIGKTRFDITGGLSSLVVLASRIAPTYHNGEFGQWAIDSKGRYKKISSWSWEGIEAESPYSTTGLSYLGDFLTNKASPALGIMLSMIEGKDFDGGPVTPASLAEQATFPITISTFKDLQDPEAAPMLASMLAEVLGIGTSTY